jgi:hypothetical protein
MALHMRQSLHSALCAQPVQYTTAHSHDTICCRPFALPQGREPAHQPLMLTCCAGPCCAFFCVLQINRPSKYDAQAAYMLGPTDPDPSLDLSRVTIIPPTPAEAAQAGSVAVAGGAPGVGVDGQMHGQPGGKYEANDNTLYIGGLPVEWTHDQVWNALGVWGLGSARLGAGRHQHPRQLITVLNLWFMALLRCTKLMLCTGSCTC